MKQLILNRIGYGHLPTELKESKQKITELEIDLRLLVLRPDSNASHSIKDRVKFEHQMEQVTLSGDGKGNGLNDLICKK